MTIRVTVPSEDPDRPEPVVIEVDADTMNVNQDGSLVLMKATKRKMLYARSEWISAEDPSA